MNESRRHGMDMEEEIGDLQGSLEKKSKTRDEESSVSTTSGLSSPESVSSDPETTIATQEEVDSLLGELTSIAQEFLGSANGSDQQYAMVSKLFSLQDKYPDKDMPKKY